MAECGEMAGRGARSIESASTKDCELQIADCKLAYGDPDSRSQESLSRAELVGDQTQLPSDAIPLSPSGGWQRSLAAAIRDPDQLIDRLELPDSLRDPARRAAERFPLLVPDSYLRRMQPGDVNDPLLRQVLPLGDECREAPGFVADPVGDDAARRTPGLLQKYAGRALLIATGSCAVHCRYCFRREYPYQQEPRRLDDWNPALEAIAADASLREVILSGGDPLMLTDVRLAAILERLAQIPHLRRLRIHSRLPIVLPDRVTTELLELLRSTRLTPIIVVHANHPQEIAADCRASLAALVQSGITTLNQAVLLRGINDDADALTANSASG